MPRQRAAGLSSTPSAMLVRWHTQHSSAGGLRGCPPVPDHPGPRTRRTVRQKPHSTGSEHHPLSGKACAVCGRCTCDSNYPGLRVASGVCAETSMFPPEIHDFGCVDPVVAYPKPSGLTVALCTGCAPCGCCPVRRPVYHRAVQKSLPCECQSKSTLFMACGVSAWDFYIVLCLPHRIGPSDRAFTRRT